MANSDNAKSNDEVHTSAEEGNRQSPPQQDSAGSSAMLQQTSEKNENQEKATTSPSADAYDSENPMPYFLAQEARYIDASERRHGVQKKDPAASDDEFRVADVDHQLSFQSICCWSLLTILLVGGSLLAVLLTVDWNVTTGGDVELTNSTTIENP